MLGLQEVEVRVAATSILPSPEKQEGPRIRALEVRGGDEEDRTPDLRIANAALSQLSYFPTAGNYIGSVTDLQTAA